MQVWLVKRTNKNDSEVPAKWKMLMILSHFMGQVCTSWHRTTGCPRRLFLAAALGRQLPPRLHGRAARALLTWGHPTSPCRNIAGKWPPPTCSPFHWWQQITQGFKDTLVTREQKGDREKAQEQKSKGEGSSQGTSKPTGPLEQTQHSPSVLIRLTKG